MQQKITPFLSVYNPQELQDVCGHLDICRDYEMRLYASQTATLDS